MGIQLRVRHALGERVLELPARGPHEPVVVGRGGDVDVQVPSVHVGVKHLHLFVREGRWVAEDAPGSGARTILNGATMKGAQPVQTGDVLTLGVETDAPTIEVNAAVASPAPDAARRAPAEESANDAPQPDASRQSLRDVPSAQPAAVAQPAPPMPGVIVEREKDGDEPGDGPGMPARTAGPQATTRPAGRPPKSSPVAVGVSVVAAVAIVTSAVVFVYVRKHQPQTTVVTVVQEVVRPSASATTDTTRPPAAPVPEIKPPPPLPDVTNEPGHPPTASATRRAPSDVIADDDDDDTPGAQFFGDNLDGDDDAGARAEMTDEERAWKRVESAYYHPNIAKSLLTLDAFAERYPDTNKERIAKYREDMLDKLWWTRIEQLLEKRKRLMSDVKNTQAAVKAEQDETVRTTVLEPRLAADRKRLAAVSDLIRKDMSYPADAAPPIGRDDQLKPFRAKRDAAKYEAWKAATLKHIRDKHGAYPWANEE